MSTKASGMNDTLRNSLVVEVEYFVPNHKVFQECRAAWTNFQGILVV